MSAQADIETDGEAGADARGGLTRRRLVIIAAAVIAALAIGGTSYFFLFAAKQAANTEAAAEVVPDTFIFNLPPMTVNLNTNGKGESFMKLSVALEVSDKAMMAEIQPRMAKVLDAFQVYLRELRKSDLEGSAGIYRLKEELRRRVNIAIAPAHVESILFKELLVQ